MTTFINYETIPVGSILILPKEADAKYLPVIRLLPENIRSLVISARTGAYIRGLIKTYDILPAKGSIIAFNILKVCIGEQKLLDLSNALSTDLQLPPDETLKIAQEIEHDLFAPVMLELNNYLAQKKTSAAMAPLPPRKETFMPPKAASTPPQQTPPQTTTSKPTQAGKPTGTIPPTKPSSPSSRILGVLPTSIKPAPHFPKNESAAKAPVIAPSPPIPPGPSNVIDLKKQSMPPKTPPPMPPNIPRKYN